MWCDRPKYFPARGRRLTTWRVALGLAGASVVACLPQAPPLESGAPRVLDVVMRASGPQGAGRWSAIEVGIEGRLSEDSLEQVTVVPLVPARVCVVSEDCEQGPCDAGRCWEDAMTAGDLRALDEGLFEGGWPVALTQDMQGDDEHVTLRIRPRRPWRSAWRYRVVFGAKARSPEGIVLDEGTGGESERWSWEFFAAWDAGAPRVVWPRLLGGDEPVDVPVDLTHVEVVAGPLRSQARLSLRSWDADAVADWVGLSPVGSCKVSDAPHCTRYRLDRAWSLEQVYALEHHRDLEGLQLGAWHAAATPTMRPRSRAFAPAHEDLQWTADGECLYFEQGATALGALHLEGAGVRYRGPSGGVDPAGGLWGAPLRSTALVGDDGDAAVVGSPQDSSPSLGGAVGWRVTTAWGTRHGRMEVPTDLELPSRSSFRITEVLADPLGPEPRQEFVEVQALRAATWSAESLWIADGRWEDLQPALEAPGALPLGDPLPPATAAAGEILLIVPEAFVADSDLDGAVLAGTQLLRVPGSLGGNGLLNAGEAVSIYEASPPRLVASFGGRGQIVTAPSGTSVVRADLGSPCDTPADWRAGPFGAPSPGGLP